MVIFVVHKLLNSIRPYLLIGHNTWGPRKCSGPLVDIYSLLSLQKIQVSCLMLRFLIHLELSFMRVRDKSQVSFFFLHIATQCDHLLNGVFFSLVYVFDLWQNLGGCSSVDFYVGLHCHSTDYCFCFYACSMLFL